MCLLRNRPVQFSRNRRGGGGGRTPRRGELYYPLRRGPDPSDVPTGITGLWELSHSMDFTMCNGNGNCLWDSPFKPLSPPAAPKLSFPTHSKRKTKVRAWLALGLGKLKNKVTFTPRKVLCYGTVPSPPNSNYQHLSVTACHVRWPFSSRCRHRGSRALGKAKKLTWLGLGLEG